MSNEGTTVDLDAEIEGIEIDGAGGLFEPSHFIGSNGQLVTMLRMPDKHKDLSYRAATILAKNNLEFRTQLVRAKHARNDPKTLKMAQRQQQERLAKAKARKEAQAQEHKKPQMTTADQLTADIESI